MPGDNPNRILFRSNGGTVELAGMVELYPIRPNLTEAVLTVEYEAPSPLQKAIDAMATALDGLMKSLAYARVRGGPRQETIGDAVATAKRNGDGAFRFAAPPS